MPDLASTTVPSETAVKKSYSSGLVHNPLGVVYSRLIKCNYPKLIRRLYSFFLRLSSSIQVIFDLLFWTSFDISSNPD